MPDEHDEGRRPELIPEELLREMRNVISLQRDAQETNRIIFNAVEKILTMQSVILFDVTQILAGLTPPPATKLAIAFGTPTQQLKP